MLVDNTQLDHINWSSYLNATVFSCLDDELDIVLDVAVVIVIDNTEAVGEDPHLHGSVSTTGEDVIGRSHLYVHDARAEVPEKWLPCVFVWEGVEETLCAQAPNLRRPGQMNKDVTITKQFINR